MGECNTWNRKVIWELCTTVTRGRCWEGTESAVDDTLTTEVLLVYQTKSAVAQAACSNARPCGLFLLGEENHCDLVFFRESQHGWGWKQYLEVIWSKALLKQGYLEQAAQENIFNTVPFILQKCMKSCFPEHRQRTRLQEPASLFTAPGFF